MMVDPLLGKIVFLQSPEIIEIYTEQQQKLYIDIMCIYYNIFTATM